MKTADVKLGSVYLTRIAGELCPVVVVRAARRLFNYTLAKETGPTRYTVQRVGERAPLPKSRTAAALREVPAQQFKMIDQPWPVLVRRAYQPGNDARFYDAAIDAFGFATTLEAKSAAHAAVLAARGMVARAVFAGFEVLEVPSHAVCLR